MRSVKRSRLLRRIKRPRVLLPQRLETNDQLRNGAIDEPRSGPLVHSYGNLNLFKAATPSLIRSVETKPQVIAHVQPVVTKPQPVPVARPPPKIIHQPVKQQPIQPNDASASVQQTPLQRIPLVPTQRTLPAVVQRSVPETTEHPQQPVKTRLPPRPGSKFVERAVVPNVEQPVAEPVKRQQPVPRMPQRPVNTKVASSTKPNIAPQADSVPRVPGMTLYEQLKQKFPKVGGLPKIPENATPAQYRAFYNMYKNNQRSRAGCKSCG